MQTVFLGGVEGVAGGWGLGLRDAGRSAEGDGGREGCCGCRGQACVSWESWVLHLNVHMLRPSGGCMNAHGDRWPRPITMESERPGPPGERGRGRSEGERCSSADPIKKRDEGEEEGDGSVCL